MSFRKVSLCSIWAPWKMEFYFPFPFLKFHEWNIGTQEIQVEASSFTYVPLCIPYDKYQIILTKTMANIVVNILRYAISVQRDGAIYKKIDMYLVSDTLSYVFYNTVSVSYDKRYLRYAIRYNTLIWLINGFQTHSNELFELNTGYKILNKYVI